MLIDLVNYDCWGVHQIQREELGSVYSKPEWDV